ncbi:MAG: hypothetical protein DYG96_08005 [Chlorobi bacterium CHB2]|nr:hypothetical protein [Chlorobi bacterium CHB2]
MGKQLTINNVGLIVAGGALVVVAINELHPLHSNSIYLLLAAGVGAILPHLSSFKAGGVEVTLREIESRVQEVKKTMTENREKNQLAQTDIQNRINDVAAEAARAVKREARLVWEVGGVPGGAQHVRQRAFAPANIEADAPKAEAEKAPANIEAAAPEAKAEEAPAMETPAEQEPAPAAADDAALRQFVRNLKVSKNLADGGNTKLKLDLAQLPNLPQGFAEG